MPDAPVIRHLDQCLSRLAVQPAFCRKLEFATDTHGSENWMRTEIAYEVSRALYDGVDGAKFWSFPERFRRTDIPIVEKGKKGAAALVELKVLYNYRSQGLSNRRKLESDRQKLMEQPAKHRVLLAALVFMKYAKHRSWPYLKTLADMDAFMEHALRDLPEAVQGSCKSYDTEVKPWASYRPTFAVRICRLIV